MTALSYLRLEYDGARKRQPRQLNEEELDEKFLTFVRELVRVCKKCNCLLSSCSYCVCVCIDRFTGTCANMSSSCGTMRRR
jgi:hypothetical protein